MDELLKLIDSRVSKNQPQTTVKSLPCKVIKITSDDAVTVELLSNNARYTVPNYSGSPVEVGENVLLYYTGILSEGKAYIGASINKGGAATSGFITGNVYIGQIFEQSRVIASVDFEATSQTVVQIIFNYVFLGTTNDAIYLESYVNGTKQGYKPIISMANGQYVSATFVLPLELTSGSYGIEIKANGANSITGGQINAVGHNIIGSSYEPTGDDDYIYETVNNTTNAIYYIGQAIHPEIPVKLNDKPIKIIRATAFNGTNVETVYIPDGVEEIE